MNHHRSRTGLSILVSLACVLPAARASEPAATPESQPSAPAAPAMPAPRDAEGIRVAPVDRAHGQVGVDPRPSTGVLLAEGTFIANRRGYIERLPTGDWQFQFENETGAPSLAPMNLQPCQRLAEIVRIVEARPERVTFTVSGRVFVYDAHNFLLPTTFATATQQHDATAETVEKPAVATPVDAANPSIEELVADVDQATRPAENPRASGAGPASAAEGGPRLRREGTAIVSQSGRLTRGARSWVFTIDNDADARAGDEEVAPLEILPCLNLAEMERLYERHGTTLRFIISGTVLTYKERNMLLPTMYVVDIDRDGNLTSAQ